MAKSYPDVPEALWSSYERHVPKIASELSPEEIAKLRAGRFGSMSPTVAAAVLEELDKGIEMIDPPAPND